MRIVISNLQSVRIVDATAFRKGVILQNMDATNLVFISEDQRSLDSVDAAGNPLAGFSLPNNQSTPTVIPQIRGALYARAKTAPVQLEVISYDRDNEVLPVTGNERQYRENFPYSNSRAR